MIHTNSEIAEIKCPHCGWTVFMQAVNEQHFRFIDSSGKVFEPEGVIPKYTEEIEDEIICQYCYRVCTDLFRNIDINP